MKSFFKYMFAGFFGTLAALAVIVVVGIAVIVAATDDGKPEIKENSILHLTFNDEISDRNSVKPNFMTMSFDKKSGLSDIIKAIQDAEKDANIKGIYLETGLLSGGMASVEEIRNALAAFKKSGKFIIAHADFYTHKSYYLATIADSVFMTPQGEIQFTGLSAQIMMYKDLLEKIGVQPEIIRHGKFKSAVEPFMLKEISPENREQTTAFLNSLWNKIITGIQETRKISIADLTKYADELTIRSDKAAFENKFIDGLVYKDQIIDKLKKMSGLKTTDKLKLVTTGNYAKSKSDEKEFSRNKVAVIYALGEIQTGKGDDETIGSETLAQSLRKAREDSTVKAVVLRVNSPGGSALASEIIWRETILLKNKKTFIVSMGDVAASGGYYIACNADTIVAQPNTITGSIGVFGLLFNTVGLMEKVGINISTVNTNKYSDLGVPSRKMSDFERDVIQKGVEDIYGTFIQHVAEGRKMDVAQVDSIGQGRVWSGEKAKEIGLVDVFGGLDVAIEIAVKREKLQNYRIVVYPEKNKYSAIIESVMDDSEDAYLKEKFGEAYVYLKNLEKIKSMSGIQARLPFFMEIE